MSILDEFKKWGNLGIPLKDVGTKIIDGEEKATAITLKVLLFDGE